MDFTNTPVSILCPDPAKSLTGDVGDRDREPLGPYPFRALRQAVRDWHHYQDHSLAILQDIRDVYPELGREWQDVFKFYSLGFTRLAISRYWRSIHGLATEPREDLGDQIVMRLVRRIDWLLSLNTRPLSFGVSSQDQDAPLTQSR